MTRQLRQPLSRREVAPFTWASEFALLLGVRESFFFAGVPTLEAFTLAWQAYRDEQLPQWIKERPGTRPFAEWIVELVPKHGERRLLVDRPRESFGGFIAFDILHTPEQLGFQELESTYLDRHGLLSAAEREALGL